MPQIAQPESFGQLMGIASVAVLCGLIFLAGLFVIVAPGLGVKVPGWPRTLLGALNIAAAAWWAYAGFYFEGIFFVSAMVQGLLGIVAIALRPGPASAR